MTEKEKKQSEVLEKAIEKAQKAIIRLLLVDPEMTGKVTFNFHLGSIGDRINIDRTMTIE